MIGGTLRLPAVSIASLESAAHADVVAIDSTTKGGWRVDRTTVPSAARLLLNGNGSLAALLDPVAAAPGMVSGSTTVSPLPPPTCRSGRTALGEPRSGISMAG